MSDFKAKMHQIRFRLRLAPDPDGGAYSAPPYHLAGFEGSTSKGGEGREKGRGGEAFLVMWPRRLSALNPPLAVG